MLQDRSNGKYYYSEMPFDVHYEQYGFIWPNKFMNRVTINLYQWNCGISCSEKKKI